MLIAKTVFFSSYLGLYFVGLHEIKVREKGVLVVSWGVLRCRGYRLGVIRAGKRRHQKGRSGSVVVVGSLETMKNEENKTN